MTLTAAERRLKHNAYMREYRAKNREKVRADHRAWSARNPDRIMHYQLKDSVGIGIEQYRSMSAKQNGACKVCGFIPEPTQKRLAVDHDHETGEIRSLLCKDCNTALGCARESIERLRGLADYLEYRVWRLQ